MESGIRIAQIGYRKSNDYFEGFIHLRLNTLQLAARSYIYKYFQPVITVFLLFWAQYEKILINICAIAHLEFQRSYFYCEIKNTRNFMLLKQLYI
jgi:hypothetical protein